MVLFEAQLVRVKKKFLNLTLNLQLELILSKSSNVSYDKMYRSFSINS